MSLPQKILIIRFSSFGDIVQASSVCLALKQRFPQAQIDWVTRSDMSGFLSCIKEIDHIWSFDRKKGLGGLIRLGFELRKAGFTHVYDAHANVRSLILSLILRSFSKIIFAKRSKERFKRFCLFVLRVNNFPKPYKGILSFLRPLVDWGVDPVLVGAQKWHFAPEVAEFVDGLVDPNDVILVPSAAWEMKRWPLEYWKDLIRLSPDKQFVVLGGPDDHFCEELVEIDPVRVKNLAGKLSLTQSCYAVQRCALVISADTGLLHVADVLGKRGIALLGPTAFGHPSSSLIKVMEVALACRPCTKDGRGKCSQAVYKKCLVDILPKDVGQSI